MALGENELSKRVIATSVRVRVKIIILFVASEDLWQFVTVSLRVLNILQPQRVTKFSTIWLC